MIKLTSDAVDRVTFYLASLYISFVYFSVAISNILLGLLIVTFLLGLLTRRIQLNLEKNHLTLYLIIAFPFALTLFSVINSYQTENALSYVWMRLPVAVLPFIILNLKFLDCKDLIRFAKLYIMSSLLASFVTFYNLIAHFLEKGEILKPNFKEDILTPIQHPYFAVFIVIAITILFAFKLFKSHPYIKYGLHFIFSLAVLFSTSRMALLLLLMFWCYILIIRVNKNKYRVLTIGVLGFIAFIIAANTIYKEKILNTFSYWDSPRVYLWDNAYKVLKYSDSKLTGIGVGDYYRVKRIPQRYVSSQKGTYGYNPHNQYLEFIITNGVLGFLFIFTMFYMLYISFKSKNNFPFIIILIVSAFSFTECIFNRQYGVQLYAFFMPLAFLIITMKNQDKINV